MGNEKFLKDFQKSIFNKNLSQCYYGLSYVRNIFCEVQKKIVEETVLKRCS